MCVFTYACVYLCVSMCHISGGITEEEKNRLAVRHVYIQIRRHLLQTRPARSRCRCPLAIVFTDLTYTRGRSQGHIVLLTADRTDGHVEVMWLHMLLSDSATGTLLRDVLDAPAADVDLRMGRGNRWSFCLSSLTSSWLRSCGGIRV